MIRKISIERGEKIEIQAIEPNAKLHGIFVNRFPDIPISMTSTDTLLTDLPWLKQDPVDAVLIGQAYHWFSSPSTLSLLASIMKPGAPIILTWTVEDQTVPWVKRYKSIYEVFDYCIPSYRSRRWQSTFHDPAIGNTVLRVPCSQEWFKTYHKSTVGDLISRVQSKSYIAVLSDDDKNGVCGNVRKFIENDPECSKLVEGGQVVDMPFRTELFWTYKV